MVFVVAPGWNFSHCAKDSFEPMNMYESDFTFDGYRAFLDKAASKNYQIINFKELVDGSSLDDEDLLVLRHDVDFSLHSAVKIAEIEADKAISSSFFLLLHCRFYNLLEPAIIDKVNRIIELGHHICLHFDPQVFTISTVSEFERCLAFEKNILDEYFGVSVDSFSFHNTTSFSESLQEERYAGLFNVNSYAVRKRFKYCSDSNGYWRYDRLFDLLDQNPGGMHVLTHPGWWEEEPVSPKERIMNKLLGRAKKNYLLYDTGLKGMGRENF